MAKKRILYISPLPPPHGGIATWTQCIFDKGLSDDFEITLVNTKIYGTRNIFEHAPISFKELQRFFSILQASFYQLAFNRPQMIHLCCALSSVGIFRDVLIGFLAKIFNIPFVTHYRGNLPDFKLNRFLGLSGRGLKWLMRQSKVNIVENTYSFNYLQSLNIQANKNLLLPNFVDDKIFTYPKKEITNTTNIKAIFAGGITRSKGANEILLLALELPHIEFHLYGQLHQDMADKFVNHPPNIYLHGTLSHTAILTAMSLSHFLIFPSYSEGFPLTVVEAMALGLPIIGTHVGALPDMVDQGLGGYLVAPGDVDALTKAIRTLITTPDYKQLFGTYNQQKSYSHYRYSKVVTDLQSVYQQLLMASTSCAG